MICIKCNKRPAVVFLQRLEAGETKNEGYCLSCAQKMGLKPIDDMMKQFGISPEDLENMEEQMSSFMTEMKAANGDDEDDDDDEDNDGFKAGGSATFPFDMLKNFGSLGAVNNTDGIAADGEDKGPAIDFDSFGTNDKTSKSKDDKKNPRAKEKGKKRKFIDTYCENLTDKAKNGQLDNIIGRDKEIYRTIQILSRRQKNNPCLIGEAGVGKTAIAEGIAIRIADGDVPSRLADKEIQLLDLTALVAGTQFRGQFESRVKGLVGEVKAAGNIILFIDEIHTITAAGDSEGAMNAANILKPALSRGEIQVIGATTFAEYRKYIEKDQALERRFQPIKVEEPSIDDTISVLIGIKEYYEKHHYVKISPMIVEQSVTMSERYITDRFLPDKAIDLLDESAACCSLRHPVITEYVKLCRKLEELKQEEQEFGGKAEKDDKDYETGATLKSEIMRHEKEIKEKKAIVENIEVTSEDVAKVVELWTGIPAIKIQQSEYQKINGLEESLSEKIIGQPEAVKLVAKAIKRTRAGISGRRRPASFVFVGPTGTGKTELVKQLATELFDTVDPIIRLDMSEFMEKHTVSRMIGSPPGYLGYDEAGQLTEKVRRRPYSVVLFDEIEKAHPDVMNILLQILDEGRINDAQGRAVSFENTVICMTSNAGSGEKTGETGFAKTKADISRDKMMKALNDFLRPEFLARVDEVICFKPLEDEDLMKIAALMLDEYKTPLMSKGKTLKYTESGLKALCKLAADGKFNARDLRRTIRKEVEDAIAERLLDGNTATIYTVDEKDDKIVLTDSN